MAVPKNVTFVYSVKHCFVLLLSVVELEKKFGEGRNKNISEKTLDRSAGMK